LEPKPTDSMPLGIVLERRPVDNPWQDHEWRLIGVLPGAARIDAPLVLDDSDDVLQIHAATLDIELFKGETEGYRANLTSRGIIYVVLRETEEESDLDVEYAPFLATVCPYEAQDYMDSSEERVDVIAMPPDMVAWVATFVEQYHVEQPFKKRKRDSAPGSWQDADAKPGDDNPRDDKPGREHKRG